MERLTARLKEAPLVAVLVIDDAEDALPLGRALLKGGVRAMELTLRTPIALDALERIVAELPEMLAGVGTILTPEQAEEAKRRGAAFGVAPGMNPRVIRAAMEAGLPFAPGIATPSDLEAALELGCTVMKIFPAEPLGGVSYLKAIHAPYAHRGVSFIPLGGLSAANLQSYLECPQVLAIGGSWIATRELIQKKNWDAIRKNAEEAMTIVARVRGTGGK
jgi:2-dehydro-3-deoxyphosphogluconate aldolase/(4S)-4-hydroxy-2-oxoglutarate aldolase